MWVPSLVASSKRLGLLPGSLVGSGVYDRVDWVPVDALGRIVVDLGLESLGGERRQRRVAATPAGPRGATVYQAVNPKMTRWAELVLVVAEVLGGAGVVPLESWVAALRESAAKRKDLVVNPAVKILDFSQGYEGLIGGSRIHLDA